MLHEFLTAHRTELLARCRAKVAQRPAPGADEVELDHGMGLFLDQLIKTLEMEQTSEPMLSRNVSGPAGGEAPPISEIGEAAVKHGRELLSHGFTIEQVVHDYGDMCQAITDLAFEMGMQIDIDEFRTLNRCLDNAIATAVTEFTSQRDSAVATQQVDALNERLGIFAHEVRNSLHTATLALAALKTGKVGLSGATGSVLERSLVRLRGHIDRSLSEVRITAGLPIHRTPCSLREFIAEMQASVSLEAEAAGCSLHVASVDPRLGIDVDRDLLFSALGNLLQNAFKFTLPGTAVALNAYASGDSILICVEDHCGGLAPGTEDKMFLPFTQTSENKTGLGLGLSIARRSIEANGGTLTVQNSSGIGCVFTIELPRRDVSPVPATHLETPHVVSELPN